MSHITPTSTLELYRVYIRMLMPHFAGCLDLSVHDNSECQQCLSPPLTHVQDKLRVCTPSSPLFASVAINVCDLQFPADFFSNFNTNFNSIAAGSGSVSSVGTGNQEALASGSGSQSTVASGQNAFASAVSGTGGSLLHGSWSPRKLALMSQMQLLGRCIFSPMQAVADLAIRQTVVESALKLCSCVCEVAWSVRQACPPAACCSPLVTVPLYLSQSEMDRGVMHLTLFLQFRAHLQTAYSKL